MDKLRIRQAIVVEGKYDQNALRQLVDTAIFTTNGFTGMKDPALLRLLRQAAETTGLIILTDSDGAGFLIRNTLKSALPAEGVLHAYIPDIPGKERRKTAPAKRACSAWRACARRSFCRRCETPAPILKTRRPRPRASLSQSRTFSPSAFPAGPTARQSVRRSCKPFPCPRT